MIHLIYIYIIINIIILACWADEIFNNFNVPWKICVIAFLVVISALPVFLITSLYDLINRSLHKSNLFIILKLWCRCMDDKLTQKGIDFVTKEATTYSLLKKRTIKQKTFIITTNAVNTYIKKHNIQLK